MPNSQHPRRNSLRLPGYDYSQAGAYFVTVCTQDRLCLLGRCSQIGMELTPAGAMALDWWSRLSTKFSVIASDHFIVMPNHVHGIVQIHDNRADTWVRPYLNQVVQWWKTMTTNAYLRGVKTMDWPAFPGRLWQRGYHEHIIRNEEEYQAIAAYIRENPSSWQEDQLYLP